MSLRIAQVVPCIDDPAAGTSRSVPALCEHLAALGHQVELHVLGEPHEIEGCSVYTHPHVPGGFRIGFSPAMQRALAEAATRVQVMHWHGLWMFPDVYPYWAVRGTGCRLVVSPRGMLSSQALERRRWLKKFLWAAGQGQAVRRAECIHATSEDERRSVRALGLSNPTVVVPNGVELPEANPRQHANGLRHLLFLARIHPIKGVDRLLRAWRAVQDQFPSWRLSIVGPDADGYAQRMKELARELGVERVEFGPGTYGEEHARLLASAELYILPSHSENFGMSVAEALAAGVPVICGRGAPWGDLVKHRAGYWVDNSVESLAGCLREAFALSAEELRGMGARGRAWMQKDFSWRHKAEQMSLVYEALVSGKPLPRELATDPKTAVAVGPHA
jgi:glycosyltransferase involved in cell wall biosynthesis